VDGKGAARQADASVPMIFHRQDAKNAKESLKSKTNGKQDVHPRWLVLAIIIPILGGLGVLAVNPIS